MFEIKYKKPKVKLLQDTGIGTSEIGARTCYKSIEKSENKEIVNYQYFDNYKLIENSNLLQNLAWTSFHYSVLEHAVLTYHIKNISRGVLQELVRHRIASYSVQSTRYTLSEVLFAFSIVIKNNNLTKEEQINLFNDFLLKFNTLIIEDINLHKLEVESIFNKLNYHYSKINNKDDFFKLFMLKDNFNYYNKTSYDKLDINILLNNKSKRNAGDNFKYIITDNFSTELVWTINLRSLKNFIQLRDNKAAWFQIQWLAKEIINVTPDKYLLLIIKNFKGINNEKL